MEAEREKKLIESLKLVSPGSPLRGVIADLIRSGLGAMIVFDSKAFSSGNFMEGGFRINCRFTPEKLFELCKMDGAVIISDDLKRILYGNVLITPDHNISSNETGTRHKAAERIAKQASTMVIAVSERRKKTTIYQGNIKYYLKSSEDILNDTSFSLNILEKQREKFKENINNLDILEMSGFVSVRDVCEVIQKSEMVLKISKSIRINFTELGREGNIMHMRYRELVRGVEKEAEEILRDYSSISMRKSKKILSNMTFDGLLDLESISRLTLEKSLDENTAPKGFRFLSHLTLSKKEIISLINKFGDLNKIIKVESSEFESILKNRSSAIFEEIKNLREQILNGKFMF